MLYLRTFGGAAIEREGVPQGGAAAQRRLLAVATLIAAGGELGVSRDRVLSVLWADSDPERARHALNQTLYHMRRALGEDELFVAATDLRFSPEAFSSDIADFENAVDRGEDEQAVAIYRGPFLDGFYVSGASEFERWTAAQRSRLARRHADALDRLATGAERAGEFKRAVEVRRALATQEPLSGRVALDLMTVLAAAGDRAGALQYARVHRALVRDELEAEPDAAVVALESRLREEPAWRPAPRSARTMLATPPEPSNSLTRESENPPGAHGPQGVPYEKAGWDRAEPDREARPTPVAADASFAREQRKESDAASPDAQIGSEPGTAIGASRRRIWRIAMIATAIVLTASLTMLVFSFSRQQPLVPIDPELIAVAPFKVSGEEPSLLYLREGMMDLLVAKLTGVDSSRAAAPATVLGAWHRLGGNLEDLPRDEALKAAREIGAGQLLLGQVVGTPEQVVLTASLLSVPSGVVAMQASVEGPTDSLMTLVDRLTGQLLAEQAGERERLASHTTASLDALRAYLGGQASYRQGDYSRAAQSFKSAMERDSGFALAALGLALSADRLDAGADRARGVAMAWKSREELSARDGALLEALAGPRYPDSSSISEELAAWEHAAALAPERAEAWHELGERLFTDGWAVGIKSPSERAAAAFTRARSLDGNFLPPLFYLALVAAHDGDAGEMRARASRYVRAAPSSDYAAFLRWRVAAESGDDDDLARARSSFDSLGTAALRWVALASQYDAVALDDGARALDLLRSRAARGADRLDAVLGAHSLAMNTGRIADAISLTSDLDDGHPLERLGDRLEVLDALYGTGDSAATALALERLTSGMRGTRGEYAAADACVSGQWAAWHDSSRAPRLALRAIRDGSSDSDFAALSCAALIDAISATMRGRSDAAALVQRADSLVMVGPPIGDMRGYATLAFARLYERLGDGERALEAVRRRSYLRPWPHYLASYLREEGRLAAAAGEREAAARAYRQYLDLRAEPDSTLRPQVDSVKAELGELGWRYR
jgi:DNA-binding SARP family transcriptional activator/tetratricopeptide (TPR) repeat protein